MNLSDFNYHLPEELIAQTPAERRELSRMMVVSRTSGAREVRDFSAISEYLRAGDCLVINDTRVLAARLFGKRDPSGGRVEAFLLEQLSAGRWQCLLRPGRRLNPGSRVVVDNSTTSFTVAERRDDGTFEVEFDTDDVLGLLDQAGHLPLPPYIHREATESDRERYQTVYAEKPGAVAAPTAGLHFTPEILEKLETMGVRTARVTLHVGPGTFQPVKTEKIEDHVMHEEVYELPEETAAIIRETKARGGRVIAVGTTSVRTLESCANAEGTVTAGRGRTRIFLHPPKRPQVVDGLLTNFHLPKSTLLMLVACFTGIENMMAAYDAAVREKFRFYSYGDCMLILPELGESLG